MASELNNTSKRPMSPPGASGTIFLTSRIRNILTGRYIAISN
ncbi:MAG: hypothetical protein NTV07_05310 [Candidatus Omnitrophica bacterium]|nr:hypothetical protein [Candidatus Omnitrophota bacterium]